MPTNRLTPREKEILMLIAYEQTTPQIAQHLSLSKHTILTHRKNLLAKLHVRNIAGLVRVAIEKELISI